MLERLPNGSSVKDRLEAYSMPEPNSGCWLWLGLLDKDGYGRIDINRVTKKPHRVAYAEYVGRIPKGLSVLHRCDTPSCINPLHLFPGTHQDNMDDMKRKGRSCRGGHSNNRHRSGEANSFSKLTEPEVIRIIDLSAQGDMTQKEIGEIFGISQSTVSEIKRGENWSYLTTRP